MVIFLIIGSQWIFIESLPDWQVPIPIGLIIGLVFATHEHFMIDRKIEFAILLIASFISFWLPIGIVITI
jgi:ABC-type dipeptide/oligopeptide/nickel transport system permease component